MTDLTANLSRMAEATDSEDRAVSLSVARGAGTDLVELNGLVVDNSESLNLHHEISAEPNQRQAHVRGQMDLGLRVGRGRGLSNSTAASVSSLRRWI